MKKIMVLFILFATIDWAEDTGAELFHAAEDGDWLMVEYLIDYRVKLDWQNSEGVSVLMLAAKNGHQGIVNILIQNGANIDAANNDGWTALMLATENGHQDIVNTLIQNGANIDASEKPSEDP